MLLGLLAEGEGVAARALDDLGVSLEVTRQRVEEALGPSGAGPSGSPPFTPRAKKVLELALREALQAGHNYIGTEHILLGLLDEGESLAASVLVGLGIDLEGARAKVGELLGTALGWPPARQPGRSGSWVARASSTARPATFVACSFCGRRPPDSGRLVAAGSAYICEHCLRHWTAQLEHTPPEPDPPVEHLHAPEGEVENKPGGGEPSGHGQDEHGEDEHGEDEHGEDEHGEHEAS